MTLNLAELLTRHQNLTPDAGHLPLKKQLEHNFAQFFLSSLEALSGSALNVTVLQHFLEKHFHLFKHSVFCLFSRPTSRETQTLIEIASYCSAETDQPFYTFLLPGIVLSPEQQSYETRALLQKHILSNCSTKLIPSNSLLLAEDLKLSLEEQGHLKSRSVEQRFFHERGQVQQAREQEMMFFLGRIEELLMALQDHENAYEIVFDFNMYYPKALSDILFFDIPSPLHNAIGELLEDLLKRYQEQGAGNRLFLMNPELIMHLSAVYIKYTPYLRERAIASRPTFVPQLPPPAETIHTLRDRLFTNSHTKTWHGTITAELLQTINAHVNILSANDLKLLEHVSPSEFCKIITKNTPPLRFQVSAKALMSAFTKQSLLLFLTRLTPLQVEAFCQQIPVSSWESLLGSFDGLYDLLWFFHHEPAYAQALIIGILEALPSLIAISLSEKRIELVSLLSSKTLTREIQELIEKIFIENMELFHKSFYFYAFLELPGVAKKVSTKYWIASFQKEERNISVFLPSLPPASKKDILLILTPLIISKRLILSQLSSLLICLKETLSLKMPRQYLSILDFFNKEDGQKSLCHLLAAVHSPEEFNKNLNMIYYTIYHGNPLTFGSFFKEALRYPSTNELLLRVDILPRIIKFLIKESCHEALSEIFDELSTATLSFPTDDLCYWSPEVFQCWLEYENTQATRYQNIRSLPPSLLQRFYRNTHEQITLLFILSQYGLTELASLRYHQLMRDGFSDLQQKILQESAFSAQSFLSVLERLVIAITNLAPHDYPLFFQEILMPCAQKNHHLFTALSVPILLNLIRDMSPLQTELFVFSLMTTPSFQSMDITVIPFLFSKGRELAGRSPQLVKAVSSLHEFQRAECFKTFTWIDLPFDYYFIFTMQDILSYLSALRYKVTPIFFSQLVYTFFGNPAQVRHLVKEPPDWAFWLKMMPQANIPTAFLHLMSSELRVILPILGDRMFRDIFSFLEREQFILSLKASDYPEELLITALIKLGCKPEYVLQLIPQITEQGFSFSLHISLIFDSLKSSSKNQQLYWSYYLIRKHLKETAITVLDQSFRKNLFSGIFSHLNAADLALLLDIHHGHESVIISLLSKMGLPHDNIAYLMYKIPMKNYLNIWENFEKNLPARDFDESFYAVHETLAPYQIQRIVRSIYQSKNMSIYEKFFPWLYNAAKIFENDELFFSYFSDKESILFLIRSTRIPLLLRNTIAHELLLESNNSKLKKIGLSTQEIIAAAEDLQHSCQEALLERKLVLFMPAPTNSGSAQSGFIFAATHNNASTRRSPLCYSHAESESSPCNKSAEPNKATPPMTSPLSIKKYES